MGNKGKEKKKAPKAAIKSDVLGSYTGKTAVRGEKPVQDADDL